MLWLVVKLGDGGQETGYGKGVASGSIISRIVYSYWNSPNMYRTMLRGVVTPGNDRDISKKIAKAVGGWELRVRGDVWDNALLERLSVQELLEMMEVEPQPV
jgi:cytidylate kinase